MDRSLLMPHDRAFIESFETCAIAAADWNHRCHIRMAWIYLRQMPLQEAMEVVRANIQRFGRANNVPDLLDRGYHETMTVAWMRLVASAMANYGACSDSDAFCEAMPHLLSRTLLRVFYSRDRIMTIDAKSGFVPPDLASLPG